MRVNLARVKGVWVGELYRDFTRDEITVELTVKVGHREPSITEWRGV